MLGSGDEEKLKEKGINVNRYFRGEELIKERREKAEKEAGKKRIKKFYRQPIGGEEEAEEAEEKPRYEEEIENLSWKKRQNNAWNL